MRKRLLGAVLLGGAVLPVAGAGGASASERPSDLEQAASAGSATVADAGASFLDAADGPEPEGADGLGTEFPQFDPRFVEGPAGGLLDDPFG
ncbi:hypothetical protein FHX44_116801 [Pseudonocardia hierapolitana]|uniref:Uncharacterized protein n=1 Tax=Pseudonocardia hierapolitana TaxID=1128676 RepID=A0A561T159_9PSEU|nr:hypothetical protein [Pseudonocardia hierapolitana]TWF80858.1 hypothetical protein FHX44_116801 [Pseudonocardia hierapolitana]